MVDRPTPANRGCRAGDVTLLVKNAGIGADVNLLSGDLAGAHRGIVVTALHVGLMDTDMAAGIDGPKADPAEVAALGVDAIAAGGYEVLADDTSRGVQAGLAKGVAGIYPQFAT